MACDAYGRGEPKIAEVFIQRPTNMWIRPPVFGATAIRGLRPPPQQPPGRLVDEAAQRGVDCLRAALSTARD